MNFQPGEHVALDFDSHEHVQAIGTCDPPWEQIFSDLDEPLKAIAETPPAAREQAGELLRQLFTWCCGPDGQRPLRSSTVRFIVLVSGLRPDVLANRTGRSLAAELHISKQALSAQACKFEDAFGFRFGRCRSPQARKNMAEARRGGVNHNVKKQKHETITTHPTS